MACREFETGRLGKSFEDYKPGTFIVGIDYSPERNHTYAKVITKEECFEKNKSFRPLSVGGVYDIIYAENSCGVCSFDFSKMLNTGPIIVEKGEIIRELEKGLLNTKKELEFFENQQEQSSEANPK